MRFVTILGLNNSIAAAPTAPAAKPAGLAAGLGAKTFMVPMTDGVKLATDASDWRTRLHALWTLDGLDAIEPQTVVTALNDQARDVRVSAIRIAERWLGAGVGYPIHTAVLQKIYDADWAVRQQLAASIGVLPPSVREPMAVEMLERYGNDPVIVDATLSGLRGREASVLDRLLARDRK